MGLGLAQHFFIPLPPPSTNASFLMNYTCSRLLQQKDSGMHEELN